MFNVEMTYIVELVDPLNLIRILSFTWNEIFNGILTDAPLFMC